jgi:endonuclease YncB( thermonuclease family)
VKGRCSEKQATRKLEANEANCFPAACRRGEVISKISNKTKIVQRADRRSYISTALALVCSVAVSSSSVAEPSDPAVASTAPEHWEWTNPFQRDWHKPIRFQYVAVPPQEMICRGPAGVRWACGLRARIALNSFVKDRNRSIECEVKEEADAVLLRLCRAGAIELNHWLLSNGWAELAAGVSDPVLIAAERTARQNFLGIWGNGGFPTGRRR